MPRAFRVAADDACELDRGDFAFLAEVVLGLGPLIVSYEVG